MSDSFAEGGDARADWSKPIARVRHMEAIARYHRRKGRDEDSVDEQTWADLQMDEIFGVVDRTVSMPGRQVLYHQLRSYNADEVELAERFRQQQVLRHEVKLREKSQARLRLLDAPGAEYLPALLLDGPPEAPRHAWIYLLLSLLGIASLIGAFFNPLVLLAALLFAMVNAVIYMTYGQRILVHYPGFMQISRLLGIAGELGSISDKKGLPQLEILGQERATIAQVRSQLGWLVTDRTAQPDLIQALFGYLNLVFLFDIVVYLKSVHLLRRHQAFLVGLFEMVGGLDAAISAASFRAGWPEVCVPEFCEQRKFEVTGLVHPLIPQAVANDLSLDCSGALIAGPNMSGKTAFIKAVGINLILAQTLNLCPARRAVLPRAKVRSAIRREDSLSEGSSYFFTEIRQVLDFTRQESQSDRHVFLIDEIFRGTNTMERIACSAAVLRQLSRGQMVFATTHDLELQQLLAGSYEMYHFSDQVIDGRYGFDYLIRKGPVASRNAIKLLELSGYPESIIAEAHAVVERLKADRRAPSPAVAES